MLITDLIAYDKNAKIHTQDQIQKLAKSIERFGFYQPVVIDSNNVIIIGHGRVEAAKHLGWTEVKTDTSIAKKGEAFVPVVYAENLTDEEIKAFRLADNKLNESLWNNEVLFEDLTGMSVDLAAIAGFELSPETIKDVVESTEKPGDVGAYYTDNSDQKGEIEPKFDDDVLDKEYETYKNSNIKRICLYYENALFENTCKDLDRIGAELSATDNSTTILKLIEFYEANKK